MQVSGRSAHTPSSVSSSLNVRNTFLYRTVVVGVVRNPEFCGSLYEPVTKWMPIGMFSTFTGPSRPRTLSSASPTRDSVLLKYGNIRVTPAPIP